MKVESYIQGTPCWVELGTSDQEAAKSFYSELFGWSYLDHPMDAEGHSHYSMATKDGLNAAAIYTHHEGMRMDGTPPHWDIILSVEDVDATAARAAGLGGAVVEQPQDVGNAGRIAIVADPTGGAVGLWQAGSHIGAQLRHEHGTIGWCELLTTDPEAAAGFYTGLLGITSETADMPGGARYTVYMSGEFPLAGTMEMPEEVRRMNIPPHWSVYFHVDSVDETVGKSSALGATIALQPMDIPGVGRLAFVLDPQGAGFGLLTPADAQASLRLDAAANRLPTAAGQARGP